MMICNASKGSMERGRMTGIKWEDQGRQMGGNNEGWIDKGWIGLPRSREAEKKDRRDVVGCGVVRESGVRKDWDGSHNQSQSPR